MRVISGKYRRRALAGPKDASKTRPLPDRVRTAIFNMLTGHLEGQAICDVFAGTGSFGIEALSRGASRCVFVERDREIVQVLQQNIESLGIGTEAEVVQGDALGASVLMRCPKPVHIIMFDPPYKLMNDPNERQRVMQQLARLIEQLDDEGFALLRTPWPLRDRVDADDAQSHRVDVDLHIPGADGPETHGYGSTAVHWYMRKRGAAQESAESGIDSADGASGDPSGS